MPTFNSVTKQPPLGTVYPVKRQRKPRVDLSKQDEEARKYNEELARRQSEELAENPGGAKPTSVVTTPAPVPTTGFMGKPLESLTKSTELIAPLGSIEGETQAQSTLEAKKAVAVATATTGTITPVFETKAGPTARFDGRGCLMESTADLPPVGSAVLPLAESVRTTVKPEEVPVTTGTDNRGAVEEEEESQTSSDEGVTLKSKEQNGKTNAVPKKHADQKVRKPQAS